MPRQKRKLKHERIMQQHPEIDSWLRNRPHNTKRSFARELMSFSESIRMAPEEWRKLPKFQARDLAWKFVEPLIENHSGQARQTMIALKSWYRNLNGEQLPLDSSRGGKHSICYRGKKALIEKIPSKDEVYRIADVAGSLRDRAVILTLFYSGMRVNALIKLKYGDVAENLEKETIPIRITSDMDDKLRGANIPFYVTFIDGECVSVLRQYCQISHKEGKPDAPLFYTSRKKAVSYEWVYWKTKQAIRKAGLDPRTIWIHSFRKAFRKVVRQSDISDDDKEQFMGHALPGSRENYFDRHDVELLKEAYAKCNFSRDVPKSEVSKLRAQLEDEQSKRALSEGRITRLEEQIQNMTQQLNEMLDKK